MDVPVIDKFDEAYPAEATQGQRKRWNRLLSKYEQVYGRKADFVSRSPGRVNILGEHVDYSLYECLPMAITEDVLQAVHVFHSSPSKPSRIRVANVHQDKFPTREFEVPTSGDVDIDASQHEWTNYFKAGLKGASALLRRKRGKDFTMVSMDILCDGTVPAGGGLSSSAAFVCASALAVMRANGEEVVDKHELTELAIVSERSVGVNSGGMDQAASVFAQRGSGLLIRFKPSLSQQPVSFPAPTDSKKSLNFVITQSLVEANKHVTGPIHYNLRVVECTWAALFLARVFKLSKPLPQDASPLGQSLRGFHDTYFEDKEGVPDNTQVSTETYIHQLEKLIQLTRDYMIQEEGYTREEIADMLGLSVDDLHKQFTTKVNVRADRFKLRQRALHVFTEALRVQQLMKLLHDHAEAQNPDQQIEKMATLINECQESCRELYENSCPESEELCQIGLANGAWGSRQTGAGWGGCSVHIVPADKVEALKTAFKKDYFSKRHPDLSEDQLAEAIIDSKPGRGSFVFLVEGRHEL